MAVYFPGQWFPTHIIPAAWYDHLVGFFKCLCWDPNQSHQNLRWWGPGIGNFFKASQGFQHAARIDDSGLDHRGWPYSADLYSICTKPCDSLTQQNPFSTEPQQTVDKQRKRVQPQEHTTGFPKTIIYNLDICSRLKEVTCLPTSTHFSLSCERSFCTLFTLPYQLSKFQCRKKNIRTLMLQLNKSQNLRLMINTQAWWVMLGVISHIITIAKL